MRALGGERHALARFWKENRRLTDGAWSGVGGRRALSGVEAASVGGGGRTAGGLGGPELGSGSRCGEAVPTAPPLLYPPSAAAKRLWDGGTSALGRILAGAVWLHSPVPPVSAEDLVGLALWILAPGAGSHLPPPPPVSGPACLHSATQEAAPRRR